MPLPSSIPNAASMFAEGLWKGAVESLSDEERRDVDFSRADKLGILDDVLAAVEQGKRRCIEKRWKYRKGGHDVIIRDKLEKIIAWVNKFKQAGDGIVQYDPGHAALPWAGVRLILQVTVNDIQTYGAMIDAVERISNLITRYAILEAIYLSSAKASSAAHAQLQTSLTKLYTAILVYLAKARRYYDKSTIERISSAVIRTAKPSVESYLEKIERLRSDVESCTYLIDAETNQSMGDGITQLEKGIGKLGSDSIKMAEGFRKLEALLLRLDDPINRQASQVSDIIGSINESVRQELLIRRRETLQWLSRMPHRAHHKAMGTGFLSDSGKWLLEKKEFLEWRKSSVSSVLWLRGIPGSGKTMLTYSIIEHLDTLRTMVAYPAPLAFFYCVRAEAEPGRADPGEILRCILKQFSSSKIGGPVRKPVENAYKERKEEAEEDGLGEPARLTVAECEDLIIRLLDQEPATIIIDALDECDSKRRFELFRVLDNIIQKSASLVKVFVSSREDSDIVCRLENSPNILINASDNGEDIERFVRTEVDKAVQDQRLLGGTISKPLHTKIVTTLIRGAQGMFRWVSLQIDNICDPDRMNHEKDVEQELGRLPRTLKDSYRIIDERFKASGPASRTIAKSAIVWLLCAKRTLGSSEFIAAVSLDSAGNRYKISQRDLLNMRCNLVVWDWRAACFRFAHLSVQEYFESEHPNSKVWANEVALTRCLNRISLLSSSPDNSLITLASLDILMTYAIYNWPYHCDEIETLNCRDKVAEFLFKDSEIAPAFKFWMSTIKRSYSRYDGSELQKLKQTICTPPTPLLLACKFGWVDVLEKLCHVPSVEWNQCNDKGTMSALRLALRCGDLTSAQLLLKKGVDANASHPGGEPLLFEVVARRSSETVKLLLDAGADVNARNCDGATALSYLGVKGDYDITTCKVLLTGNANPNLLGGTKRTALQVLCERCEDASRKGDSPPNGWVAGINLLLSHVTDINNPGYDGYQIMRLAAVNGWTDVVNGLLKAQYEINDVDTSRSTAMQIASLSEPPEVVNVLLGVEGIDLNLANRDGWTSPRSATWAAQPRIVRMLIEAGADFNFHIDGKNTPLYEAAECGHIEILRILIDAGADVSLGVISAGAALRRSAEVGNLEMFTSLLVDDSAVGPVDRLCHTALHIAAKNGHLATVRALLAAGANVNSLNNFGWAAADLASAWGHPHIVQNLEEADQECTIVHMKGYASIIGWCFREWDEEEDEQGFPLQVVEKVTEEVDVETRE